jgi:alkanesulfonate monooxygenase SsuD/methylene tetrahydromethanopterin reductase-like flavin-dependent oxidoreductase (luciferase family)
MKFGLVSLGDHLSDPATGRHAETQAERFQLWVDMGVRAENGGFESVWLGEHHFCDYVLSSPQMVLAAIAARTRTIRLATAVTLLANHDPVRIAEDFATLDLLSHGRAEVGIGTGITPNTYRLLGQDPASASEITAESLDLLTRLWGEPTVHWKGKYRAPFDGGRLEPRTCSGKLMTIYRRYRDFRELGEVYREAYTAAGHDLANRCVSAFAYVNVGDLGWAGWRANIEHYFRFVGEIARKQGLTKTIRDAAVEMREFVDAEGRRECDVCGTPSQVVDQLKRADDELGGVDRMLCYFDLGGLPGPQVMASLDAFCEEVMPAFG